MSTWLCGEHPGLKCTPETLAKIVRAGRAGKLDD